MEDRYVKSHENKKIFYIDATNLYGNSMSQMLPKDGIEMWHGHPDLYMNKREKISYTHDDNDFGYIVEVNSRFPNKKKERTKNFPFCTANEICNKNDFSE